jgi:predicted alpha/beta-fold hydrolase
MGGNHLLRYLGSYKIQLPSRPHSGLTAAMTIGNPFDVLATGLQAKYTLYGLYDYALCKALTKPFYERRFKLLKISDTDSERIKKLKSVFEFDRRFRARFFNYNSAHKLYRDVSCGRHLQGVDIPFVVMISLDDPITKVELVPHTDLLRNPHCTLIECNKGGHCDFFSMTESADVTRHWIKMVLSFVESF